MSANFNKKFIFFRLPQQKRLRSAKPTFARKRHRYRSAIERPKAANASSEYSSECSGSSNIKRLNSRCAFPRCRLPFVSAYGKASPSFPSLFNFAKHKRLFFQIPLQEHNRQKFPHRDFEAQFLLPTAQIQLSIPCKPARNAAYTAAAAASRCVCAHKSAMKRCTVRTARDSG